ncbi:MAG: C25 family cysteine peptidase [Bacteroidales bacterium]|nr:C25 family cysteine peptidase [Bacteroidales bacterium]MCK9499234.1 C25 family cysteine peptidase [Bacteroidales bacterium]MDY0313727.1 C25 family cysteine peptidase [Bacteroidales bacterium]
MKSFSFIFVLFFFSFNLFSQSLVHLQEGRTNARIISDNQYALSFTSSLSGFDVLGVKTKDGEYIRIIVPEYYPDKHISNPELPVMTKLIEVPLDSEFEIRIKSFDEQIVNLNEYGLDFPILPNQESVSKSADYDRLPFQKNSRIYTDKEYYETQIVSVELLSKMRGVQIAQLSVSPFSYDIESNTLIVRNNIEAEIIYKNVDFQKTAQLKADKYSPAFGSAYNTLWNYKSPETKGAISRYPIKYVIVSHRMFESALDSFVKWKTKKGFYVSVAYTDEIGTTANEIKSYLQGLYNAGTAEDPAPTYVLFVGDVAQVAYAKQIPGSGWFDDGHVTDMYYCEYDGGNDYIPEVYFGRFSASSVAQLNPQIEKTLMFEKYTFPDPSFLGEVVLVAGSDNSWAPTHANGQVNYSHNYYFNDDHGVTEANVYLHPASSGQATAIRTRIGQGVGLANYTAHCDETGWADPKFSVSHISSLNNENKYFFSIGNCCLSNKFEVGECFGEALVRANKKGAVAHIGGSNSTYWDEDFYWTVGLTSTITANVTYEQSGLGAYDHLFHDRGEDPYPSAYEMIYAGNMAVEASTSSLKKYYWEIYHVMGDPSLMPYVGVPEQIQASYLASLQIGMSSLTVNTEENAYVALSNDGVLLDAVLANSSGIAVLNFDALTNVGNLDIVITKQFRAPLIQQIAVIPNDNDYDAMLSAIIAPTSQIHISQASFVPSVKIMNLGQIDLNSVVVAYILDNQEPVTLDWTGNLESLETEVVNFPEITLTEGSHIFTAFVENPNGETDQYPQNDEMTKNVLVYSGNVKIESIQSPEDSYCNTNTLSPKITIKNMDSESVSSCLISYVCEGITDEFSWTGNLASNSTTQITFPEKTFPDGHNNIVFTIESVNDGSNLASFGNSLEKNFKVISVANTIIVDILSDYFPEQNTWELTMDETSELIYTESLSNANSHHIKELCLGNGCYTFEITDSNNDGMNGWWLNSAKGSVKITNASTSETLWEYTSSGNWSSKTFQFCLDLTDIESHTANINIYPNPSTGIINIENENIISNISVFNNIGQMLENKNYKDSNISIDLHNLPNGIYFIKITDDTKVITRKITLNK